jgi:hypothetical protein
VIGAEHDMEDHCSIPTTAIERGLKPVDAITDLEPDKTGGESKKKTFNLYLNEPNFFLSLKISPLKWISEMIRVRISTPYIYNTISQPK